jgi:hypothetical protein
MLWSVEVRRYAKDLVTVMSKMREWLDVRRIEPAMFRHTVEGRASQFTCNSAPKARPSLSHKPSQAS